ncbi:MAG: 3-keto-disaccharide hydrolase, partial [Planctomycetaceae bacterium]
IEFRLPYMPYARGQGRANSGVYLQGRYEVQILDSFGLHGAENECGALYRLRPPDVNMCLPPLAWQTFDIEFHAARFDAAGRKTENARITVLHNGVAIHDNVEILRKTGNGAEEGPDPLPIRLQDHGNPVVFRNIWILDRERTPAQPPRLACNHWGVPVAANYHAGHPYGYYPGYYAGSPYGAPPVYYPGTYYPTAYYSVPGAPVAVSTAAPIYHPPIPVSPPGFPVNGYYHPAPTNYGEWLW